MENNDDVIRLSYDGAFLLKKQYASILSLPFTDGKGIRYDWFELIVAPYDPVLRSDFIDQYQLDLSNTSDYSLLKTFADKEYSVFARYGTRIGPREFIVPLLAVLRDKQIQFERGKYTDA